MTDIEKREVSLPATVPGDEVGISGAMDESDTGSVTCSIVQASSTSDRGEAGSYWFSDGQSMEAMEVVVLEIAGTRTLWAAKSAGIDAPVCRSSNRQEGTTTMPALVLGTKAAKDQDMTEGEGAFIPCDLCPHAKDDDYAKAGEKPEQWLCKRGYALMLYGEMGSFIFYVKGTALDPVRRAIVSPALQRIKRREPAAPWQTLFAWKTHKNETQKGKWWTPDISIVRPSTDEECAEYLQQSLRLRGRAGQQMEEAALDEGQQALS